MYVTKRNDTREAVRFDKITDHLARLAALPYPALTHVDPAAVTRTVIAGLASTGMSTDDINRLAAEEAHVLSALHHEYALLAGRISMEMIAYQAQKHCSSSSSSSSSSRFADAMRHARSADGRSSLHPDLQYLVNSQDENDGRALTLAIIDKAIQANSWRDYTYNYFALETLKRAYLLCDNAAATAASGTSGVVVVVETPQTFLMRVALGIHYCRSLDATRVSDADSAAAAMTWPSDDPLLVYPPWLQRTLATYQSMSEKLYTPATPTLFNAGKRKPQMASCFLFQMSADSLEGIYETKKQMAITSAGSGGIGISVTNIRMRGSPIHGSDGHSNGIVPLLRTINDDARYVDQGGGKRKGSIAVYIEPWHGDIEDFLQLRLIGGDEERRCRDLQLALWIPDVFMERVMTRAPWTLFCPTDVPDLIDAYGDTFTQLYTQYEQRAAAGQMRWHKVVPADDLFQRITRSQMESGFPYMLYKDACNALSNQQHLPGSVRSSNLCTEIVEYTTPSEPAVCNLSSIALSQFVSPIDAHTDRFDWPKFDRIVREVVDNLNAVIDGNAYPTPGQRASNLRHRPMGIGVQGVANLFTRLRLPFTSPAARTLLRNIFARLYYVAVHRSMELAAEAGCPHESFPGSPLSHGVFHWELWRGRDRDRRCHYLAGTTDSALSRPDQFKHHPDLWHHWERIHTGRISGGNIGGSSNASAGATPIYSVSPPEWEALRRDVVRYGTRNSLFVAPMPTSTTSQILGNNEAFEPFTSNVYTRRTLSGDFLVVNNDLQDALCDMGKWNDTIRARLRADRGSVQGLVRDRMVPAWIGDVFRTVWEISQRDLIEMAAERAPYIDQSQSMNVYVENATPDRLRAMHLWAWLLGLKTGSYYVHQQKQSNAAAPVYVHVPTPPATTAVVAAAKSAADVLAEYRRQNPEQPAARTEGETESACDMCAS